MAQRHEDEYFTKFVHNENGNTIVRRIHQIDVQGLDGRLHTLTGKFLPDAIVTSTGQGTKGKHLAQILLNPNSAPPFIPEPARPWPDLRDVVNFGLGFLGIVMVRFTISVISDLF